MPFKDGDRWGYKHPDGTVAIEPKFDSAGSFSEGLARIRMGDLWGYANASGALEIDPQFEQARHFSEGVAKVRLNGKWGLIDTNGFWVDSVESQSFLDDRGRFISEQDHGAWEKPPGQDGEGT